MVKYGTLFEKMKTYLKKLTNQVEKKKEKENHLFILRGLKCNNNNYNYRWEPDKGSPRNLSQKGLVTASPNHTFHLCLSLPSAPQVHTYHCFQDAPLVTVHAFHPPSQWGASVVPGTSQILKGLWGRSTPLTQGRSWLASGTQQFTKTSPLTLGMLVNLLSALDKNPSVSCIIVLLIHISSLPIRITILTQLRNSSFFLST